MIANSTKKIMPHALIISSSINKGNIHNQTLSARNGKGAIMIKKWN